MSFIELKNKYGSIPKDEEAANIESFYEKNTYNSRIKWFIIFIMSALILTIVILLSFEFSYNSQSAEMRKGKHTKSYVYYSWVSLSEAGIINDVRNKNEIIFTPLDDVLIDREILRKSYNIELKKDKSIKYEKWVSEVYDDVNLDKINDYDNDKSLFTEKIKLKSHESVDDFGFIQEILRVNYLNQLDDIIIREVIYNKYSKDLKNFLETIINKDNHDASICLLDNELTKRYEKWNCYSGISLPVVYVDVDTRYISLTTNPTYRPTYRHTANPTSHPTLHHTRLPTFDPTSYPHHTKSPTIYPTTHIHSTHSPTTNPSSYHHSKYPTDSPTDFLSYIPTIFPSVYPTEYPIDIPSTSPSNYPSDYPIETEQPIQYPSTNPTEYPSNHHHSKHPTNIPTVVITSNPTEYPTIFQSGYPTNSLSNYPSNYPSDFPSESKQIFEYPSIIPTEHPSIEATLSLTPTEYPTKHPTDYPSNYPSFIQNLETSEYPTEYPLFNPTIYPSEFPLFYPSTFPSSQFSEFPTDYPQENLIITVTSNPTNSPIESSVQNENEISFDK